MSLALLCFPIRYPSRLARQDTVVVSRLKLGECPQEITFKNDYHESRDRGRLHHAIDIFGSIGLQVVATRPGVVAQHWNYGGAMAGAPRGGKTESNGYYVRLVDDEGYVHLYGHLLTTPSVTAGDRVEAGQLLGELGESGLAADSCPHLHYQIKQPMQLSKKRSYALLMDGVYYSTRGGKSLNPYQELVRLCVAAGGVPAYDSSYVLPPEGLL
ncbi:MAG: M23 family metallopeptidase [Deltaproteobacteria bacterium]|nr:M23 family metallopeptidase [Deltaproteobacteria bacterium]